MSLFYVQVSNTQIPKYPRQNEPTPATTAQQDFWARKLALERFSKRLDLWASLQETDGESQRRNRPRINLWGGTNPFNRNFNALTRLKAQRCSKGPVACRAAEDCKIRAS